MRPHIETVCHCARASLHLRELGAFSRVHSRFPEREHFATDHHFNECADCGEGVPVEYPCGLHRANRNAVASVEDVVAPVQLLIAAERASRLLDFGKLTCLLPAVGPGPRPRLDDGPAAT